MHIYSEFDECAGAVIRFLSLPPSPTRTRAQALLQYESLDAGELLSQLTQQPSLGGKNIAELLKEGNFRDVLRKVRSMPCVRLLPKAGRGDCLHALKTRP